MGGVQLPYSGSILHLSFTSPRSLKVKGPAKGSTSRSKAVMFAFESASLSEMHIPIDVASSRGVLSFRSLRCMNRVPVPVAGGSPVNHREKQNNQ